MQGYTPYCAGVYIGIIRLAQDNWTRRGRTIQSAWAHEVQVAALLYEGTPAWHCLRPQHHKERLQDFRIYKMRREAGLM